MASILDNVVAGISQGLNNVSEGSKNFVGKAKLNTQIQNIERERDNLFQNIGLLLYNLQSSGEVNVEQCNGMCEQIKAYNEQIDNLKSQIEMLDAQKAQANIPQYAASSQPINPSSGVSCECGAVNRPEARFCAKCGKPMSV